MPWLTDENRHWQEKARAVAEKVIRPLAADYDRKQESIEVSIPAGVAVTCPHSLVHSHSEWTKEWGQVNGEEHHDGNHGAHGCL